MLIASIALMAACTKESDIFKIKADFEYTITAGIDVSFSNLSQNATKYYWDFGDNTFSDERSPNHTYKANGTYTVTLCVYDENSKQDVATQQVTVRALPPIADFSVTTGEQPLKVTTVNYSRNGKSFLWDYGDETTSTSPYGTTHKYDEMGVYKISLTVTNAVGETATQSCVVTINPPSQCLFAGVKLLKLSPENLYIRFKLIDDDVITTTWVTSVYQLMSPANLPYSYMFSTPVLMNGLADDDWYQLNLYANTTTSGDGVLFASFKFNTYLLTDDYAEQIDASDDDNAVSMYFIYK